MLIDIENMTMNTSHQLRSSQMHSVCLIILIITRLCDTCSSLNITGEKEGSGNLKREFLNEKFHYYDSDTIRDELDVNNLANLRNFSIETHRVITDDHYILKIHRLINPFIQNLTQKGVIIMQHGILGSSSFFLINSFPKLDDAKQSLVYDRSYIAGSNLAYTLSNLGYDVWLTNFRGNQYCRQHLFYKDSNPKYWSFTVDSLVQYDYKAYVKYILDYTKKPKYTFIGHSLGATVGLGSLLVHKDTLITNNLACSIFLAPVVSTKFMRGNLIPLFRMATILYNELGPFPGPAGIHQIFIQHVCTYLKPICHWLTETFIGKTSKSKLTETLNKYRMKSVISNINNNHYITSIENYDDNEIRADRFLFAHILNQSISVLVLKHIIQVHESGRLSRFNYGPRRNLDLYGTAIPPAYDLTKLKQLNLKVALVSGPSDAISTLEEIDWVAEQIKNGVGGVEKISAKVEHFNHLDLIMSNDAGRLVNKPIIDFIEQNKCF